MNKNTLLAVGLSMIVVLGFAALNAALFPPRPQQSIQQEQREVPRLTEETQNLPETNLLREIEEVGEDPIERAIVLKNSKAEAEFSNRGGILTSFRLLRHQDNGSPLEMVNLQHGGRGSFELTFGGPEAQVLDTMFNFKKTTERAIEFYRDFLDLEGRPFRLTKRFELLPDDYMVKVEIFLQSEDARPPVLPGAEQGWTLKIGPQMGPIFEILDGQKEFRKYWAFVNNNPEEIRLNRDRQSRSQPLLWAGIAGKYFAMIGIPGTPGLVTSWSNKPSEAITQPSWLAFTAGRPVTSGSSHVLRVYKGPKLAQELARYDQLHLDRIVERNMWLGWLEDILKAGLNLFYLLIPNYGVGIILLTILWRLLMTPLTLSGQRSMAAMAVLQPKIQEMQAKYKSDPGKLNEEMSKLFQREKLNPLGGCLPMLLQLPIFIAFYGLLSADFDLRGALFIPGWINDLSLPDSVLSFGDFRLPILNWNHLRILPFIMLGSQLLMARFSPTPGASGIQAKIFTLGLPIVFFFWLYEFPSGLVLYWTVANLLQGAQQYYINTHMKKNPVK